MRRLFVALASVAILAIAASCTPQVGGPNLTSYTVTGNGYFGDCNFEVEVGQEGPTAFLRVRDYGIWPALQRACGYFELNLWVEDQPTPLRCQWGDGAPYSGPGWACQGRRDLNFGGSWFGASVVGTLDRASIVYKRLDDVWLYEVYP